MLILGLWFGVMVEVWIRVWVGLELVLGLVKRVKFWQTHQVSKSLWRSIEEFEKFEVSPSK